jgi:hypothetical protein
VFGLARPKAVVVSTPNADYNALFPNLPPGQLRHPDHRFEWTRAEFEVWARAIEQAFGYRCEIGGIGAVDAERGAPTQMAIFRREGA